MQIKSSTAANFVFVLVCSGIIILDSVIVSIYSNIAKEPPALFTLLLFEGFFIFLALSNYVFLRYLKRNSFLAEGRSVVFSKLSYIIILNQLVLCALVGSIAIELIVFESYHILIYSLVIFVSFLSAIGYLLLLTFYFFRWSRVNRNRVILVYAFAFSLLVVSLVVSTLYLNFKLSYSDPIVNVRSIKTAIDDYSNPANSLSLLRTVYEISSAISFVLIWIATVFQLRAYSLRLGNVKYWILVAAPLVYYLFPLAADEFGIFDSFRLEYGREFNLVYSIVFSPYRQVGGLLFGLVFWVMSLRITRKDLPILLQTAGAGVVLLIGSTVMHGLTYIVAPPFGIMTISFMPLASYLVLLGFYSSAVLLSEDARLRKDIRKLLANNASLLDSIGTSEMEQKIRKRVLRIAKDNTINMVRDTGIQPSMEEDEMKEYLEIVMKEIRGNNDPTTK